MPLNLKTKLLTMAEKALKLGQCKIDTIRGVIEMSKSLCDNVEK